MTNGIEVWPSKADFPAAWLTRRLCEEGFALIKQFEGLALKAYQCPGGVWTIGYGHTRTAKPGMVITKEEAAALLSEDVEATERAVARLVDVPLSDTQFAALVSFAFNVGTGNFERSTLLRLLNRGWYEQVPAQLLRWSRIKGEVSGGLYRRRAAEGEMWKRGASP